jgi:hypothetical protein
MKSPITGKEMKLVSEPSTLEYKGKKYIDFLRLQIPQNVNIFNEEIKGTPKFIIQGPRPDPSQIQYISIGWSNYGEVYIVADTRMPNTIMVIFRGTYSAKTAALYSKPTSLTPLKICPDSNEEFLYGILKPTLELIHTIIESIHYLTVSFLGQTDPNSVHILTTGHSLGGAMATNFAYLWQKVKATSTYNTAQYNNVQSKIICVSLGAPRCMGKQTANSFCKLVEQKQIIYLRITTQGDPVTAMPLKFTGYEHPCSTNVEMRNEVVENCNALLQMTPFVKVNYFDNLNCSPETVGFNVQKPINHTIYLDVLYISAVNIQNFVQGMALEKEVSRGPHGETIARIILFAKNKFNIIFFNVEQARESPSNVDSLFEQQLLSQNGGMFSFKNILEKVSKKFTIGGTVAEDIRVSPEAFMSLINQMKPMYLANSLPMSGNMATSTTFTNKMMPTIGCASLADQDGGKKKNTRRKRKKRNISKKRFKHFSRFHSSKRKK